MRCPKAIGSLAVVAVFVAVVAVVFGVAVVAVVFVVVGVAVDLHVCRLGLRFATDLCHPLC